MGNLNHTSQPMKRIAENFVVCDEIVNKLSATCCLSDRSIRMNELVSMLSKLAKAIASITKTDETNDAHITSVIEIGGIIGQLHVSCCSPTREELYQHLLKSLNNIHNDLWELKGVSH